MGYFARPVRQRVVVHPLLSPVFNPATHALVRLMKALRPGNPVIAKAEGMMRFYLQGKRGLTEQSLPKHFENSPSFRNASRFQL